MDINELFRHDIDESVYENRFKEVSMAKKNYHGALPLLDFGIGEDKSLPNRGLLFEIITHLWEKKNHKYTDDGLDDFKTAARHYLKRRFDVEIDEKEVAITMGTKSALATLPLFLIEKGDYLVTFKPSYIIMEKNVLLLKGKVYQIPIKGNGELPDLSTVPAKVWEKTKILLLNFPHNPTGEIASSSFYQEAIALARKYNFLIINDAAYVETSAALTIISPFLKEEGAKEVGIELFTLSKSHNMTGFRLGFIAGNEEIIKKFIITKDLVESGQYAPIQYAGIYALNNDKIPNHLKEKYQRRKDRLFAILFAHGFKLSKSVATFFLYAEAPRFIGEKECLTAKSAAIALINNFGIVTIPYDDVEPRLRFSVTFDADNDDYFFEQLVARLKNLQCRY